MIKYADFREAKIRYADIGKGRVVVLLHGFMEDLKMWDALSSELSKRFRVICIDLPGFGDSPSIGYIHSMEMLAKCVKAVMDNERLRRYVIVGHSMGGYVALAFTELFHDNVSGLCLFHSTAAADSDEKKKNRAKAIDIVKKNPKAYIRVFFEALFAENNVLQFKKEIETLRKRAENINATGIVNSLEGMKNRSNREWMLQMANYPITFIIGKHDNAIQYEIALKQAELVKKKSVLFLENAGHMGFIEEKETTQKFIKKYVSDVFRKKFNF